MLDAFKKIRAAEKGFYENHLCWIPLRALSYRIGTMGPIRSL